MEFSRPENSPGVGSRSLLQGIFPTQGSNPSLLHFRQILYQLTQHGSPRILEWVAYPFSRGISRPGNWTGFAALKADSLPAELSGKHLVTKWCSTLCDSMDCSPPGSSAHGIFQARILEWVDISFSILRHLLIIQLVYFEMSDQENFRKKCSVGTTVLSLAMALPSSGEIFCWVISSGYSIPNSSPRSLVMTLLFWSCH